MFNQQAERLPRNVGKELPLLSLYNNPEERSSHLLREGRQKSRMKGADIL